MANEYWLTDEAWAKIGLSIPTGWRDVKKVEALSIDSTTSKAHRGGSGRKGGRTTKIHAVTDAVGRVIDFALSAGQAGDIWFAISLLSRLPAPNHRLADTAYDGDAFRAFLIGRETVPVIRPNPTRKRVPASNEARYKQRNVVERCFSHLKDWRRVATSYDKLARNFAASLALADILIWWT